MASKGNNLSKKKEIFLSNPTNLKIGIIVSQWNNHITNRLLEGALSVLEKS